MFVLILVLVLEIGIIIVNVKSPLTWNNLSREMNFFSCHKIAAYLNIKRLSGQKYEHSGSRNTHDL